MSWGWHPRHAGHADLLETPSHNEHLCEGFTSEGICSASLFAPLELQNHNKGGDLEYELHCRSWV